MSKSTLLEIGKIVNTHGLKGEVKVSPWCDDPQIYATLGELSIKGGAAKLKITGVKFHKNSVILKLSGVDTIEDAEGLKNEVLYEERERLGTLPPMTYYVEDLIGLEVFEGCARIGRIAECFPTGSNDVYVVETEEGQKVLIPAIKSVVKNIDIEGRRMDVLVPAGLSYED
ncbi:ribosome maturation factor RimM [Clostridia bacterium]|nr:ribosome maturation factor RimM [Clostridia bacterium]